MQPILECKNLVKCYSSYQPALNAINLNFDRGRKIGLLGPNGSGKSTLMKLANGLLVPTTGEILINGKAPSVTSKRAVAYLPERTYLPEWMKVNQALDYFADFYDNFNRIKAEDMLRRLDIDLSLRIRTMSKGTREKVQLVLVMSREADMYLLDEPIGGVDPAARDYILETIFQNYNPGATLVICTHLIYDIEKILDDVIFLNKGKVALESSVREIYEGKGTTVDALFREEFRC